MPTQRFRPSTWRPSSSAVLFGAPVLRHAPILAFGVVFVATCYVGALILMFGPSSVRATYVELTGGDLRPLTSGQVAIDLVLLNAGMLLLLAGWFVAGRIRSLQRQAPRTRAPSPRARRVALAGLAACLLFEALRLGMNGSLSHLASWHDYAQLVAARQQVLNGLWFGDFVLIYTVIPLLVAFLFAELLSGCWLTGARAYLAMATLLVALVMLNVAIFQKRSLIDALLLVTFVSIFRLLGGPRRGEVSLVRGVLLAAGVVAVVYLVGLLAPLVRGSAYAGSGGNVSRPLQGAGFTADFEDGAAGWNTTTGNFLIGGARSFVGPGASGLGLEVWALPGQGVAYPTSLVTPPGSDWLLTASLRSSVPEETVLSLGVPGLDAASEAQATGPTWTLHALCWNPVQQTKHAALAFEATRRSRLYIDDVRLRSLQRGSCRDWKVVQGALLPYRLTRPSVPSLAFLPPLSSIGHTADLSGKPVVTFPDPSAVVGEAPSSILLASPVIGFLTRTAGPAISYPALYPHVFPYEPLDLGLDLIGIGHAANDNITSWEAMFPTTPGGANAVPFMFALYAQGGVAVALVGAFVVGCLWWMLWMAAQQGEELLVYRPGWMALTVIFGVSLAGDSLRDALLAGYGIVWPMAGLALIAAGRQVRRRRADALPGQAEPQST
jgi:hypothetical protein